MQMCFARGETTTNHRLQPFNFKYKNVSFFALFVLLFCNLAIEPFCVPHFIYTYVSTYTRYTYIFIYECFCYSLFFIHTHAEHNKHLKIMTLIIKIKQKLSFVFFTCFKIVIHILIQTRHPLVPSNRNIHTSFSFSFKGKKKSLQKENIFLVWHTN